LDKDAKPSEAQEAFGSATLGRPSDAIRLQNGEEGKGLSQTGKRQTRRYPIWRSKGDAARGNWQQLAQNRAMQIHCGLDLLSDKLAHMASQPSKDSLLWWVIPGVLAGMPMPFIHPDRRLNSGGSLNAYNDELPELFSTGIRAVVCLLNIPSDAAVFEPAGFAFLCLPVANGEAPTTEQAMEFFRFVDEQRVKNQAVAVHCEGGLGRTGTMLAAYLISKGDTALNAIRQVRAVENSAVETARQIRFLERFEFQIKNG
jgi:hypothetical protein